MRKDTFWKKVKLWIKRDRIKYAIWYNHFGLLPSTWNIRGGYARIPTCGHCKKHREGECQGSFDESQCNSLLMCIAKKSEFTGETRCRDEWK